MASQAKLSRTARLSGAGPKRVLSIDACGPRAMLAVGALAEIEARLARRSGARGFRLCDYFDLIGGASTGALIAAALALGKSMAEIAQLHREIAPSAFSGPAQARPRFDSERLEAALKREFVEHELGSPGLRCGLALFAKRADTGEAVSFSNVAQQALWRGQGGEVEHGRLLLRRLVRASMAGAGLSELVNVPLSPAGVAVAEAPFADASLAGFADPSFALLNMATRADGALKWEAREERLLLISIGAGVVREARVSLDTIAADSGRSALATLQALGASARPWRIDDELGDMSGARLTPWPLLTFQRFDVRLAEAGGDVAALAEGRDLVRLHEVGKSGVTALLNRSAGDPDWEARMFHPRFDPPGFGAGKGGSPRLRIEAMAGAFGARDPRN